MTVPRVIVMGASGAGKSTIGPLLAGALAVPFAEGDDFHTATAVEKMAQGTPLDDDDRAPWLEAIGEWLAAQERGGVASCSALRRGYRDALRRRVGDVFFVYLRADAALLTDRIMRRPDHFMPASLVDSQLDLLDDLGDDEPGVTLDATQTIHSLVADARAAVGD